MTGQRLFRIGDRRRELNILGGEQLTDQDTAHDVANQPPLSPENA